MNNEKINNQSVNNKKSFFTAEEISKYFRIPLSTVYCLSKQGRIKGIKIGKHWRYAVSSITEYLSTGTDFSTIASRRAEEYIERRDYPRINCYLNCAYRINIPFVKNISCQGIIRNVSVSGSLLSDIDKKILKDIDMDDPIELNFTPGDKNIITIGRIVRKTGEGFAVKFRNINEEYKNVLVGYIG